METVSITYVLGLLGLVSLVILGFLFVAYCHETGLKLTPKLSWGRVALNFLSSFWRDEKELITLKREIKDMLKYFKGDDYLGGGLCAYTIGKAPMMDVLLHEISNTHTYWWPCSMPWSEPWVNKKESARPRILYLEFMLKNVHLVHEFIKVSKKLDNNKELSVSELEGLKNRASFLKSFLSPTQIR